VKYDYVFFDQAFLKKVKNAMYLIADY